MIVLFLWVQVVRQKLLLVSLDQEMKGINYNVLAARNRDGLKVA